MQLLGEEFARQEGLQQPNSWPDLLHALFRGFHRGFLRPSVHGDPHGPSQHVIDALQVRGPLLNSLARTGARLNHSIISFYHPRSIHYLPFRSLTSLIWVFAARQGLHAKKGICRLIHLRAFFAIVPIPSIIDIITTTTTIIRYHKKCICLCLKGPFSAIPTNSLHFSFTVQLLFQKHVEIGYSDS